MSCLFVSLSKLYGSNERKLREEICNFMIKDPTVCSDLKVSDFVLDFKDLKSYVNNMRRSSSMGGAIEIQSFCEMKNVSVIVKERSNGRMIEFIPSKFNGIVLIIERKNKHYEPIKRINKSNKNG